MQLRKDLLTEDNIKRGMDAENSEGNPHKSECRAVNRVCEPEIAGANELHALVVRVSQTPLISSNICMDVKVCKVVVRAPVSQAYSALDVNKGRLLLAERGGGPPIGSQEWTAIPPAQFFASFL